MEYGLASGPKLILHSNQSKTEFRKNSLVIFGYAFMRWIEYFCCYKQALF